MRWWKRNSVVRPTPEKEALARKIAGWIIWLQVRAALNLRSADKRLSDKRRKVLYVTLFILFTGYFIWLLATALFYPADARSRIIQFPTGGVPPVAQPPPMLARDTAMRQPGPIVPPDSSNF